MIHTLHTILFLYREVQTKQLLWPHIYRAPAAREKNLSFHRFQVSEDLCH